MRLLACTSLVLFTFLITGECTFTVTKQEKNSIDAFTNISHFVDSDQPTKMKNGTQILWGRRKFKDSLLGSWKVSSDEEDPRMEVYYFKDVGRNITSIQATRLPSKGGRNSQVVTSGEGGIRHSEAELFFLKSQGESYEFEVNFFGYEK